MTQKQPQKLSAVEITMNSLFTAISPMLKNRAPKIVLEVAEEGFHVTSTPENSTTPQNIVQTRCAGVDVLNFFVERSFLWPDWGDDPSIASSTKAKRLLVAQSSTVPTSPWGNFLADVIVSRKIGTTVSVVTLLNIRYSLPPVEEMFDLSESSQQILEHCGKLRNGILLGLNAKTTNQPDGCAALLAVCPDAVFVKRCDTVECAEKVVALAERSVVVVGMSGSDCIDAELSFLGLLREKTEAHARAVELLQCAMSFHGLRRVCQGCAKSTPIDSRTIDRIPTVLRGSMKSSYMFGRGCTRCGHSAYSGFVGISSCVRWDKPAQQIYLTGGGAAELALHAYRSGTRTSLEDGLQKIFSGQTSFEEVLAATSQISPAFATAITSPPPQSTTPVRPSAHEPLMGSEYLASRGAPSSVGQQTSKPVLMIVEDDPDQRGVLELVFTNAGYDVVGAENGQAALTGLRTRPVDAIVCDAMMPVMNGAQLVKNLKETPELKRIPILILTAVANPDAEVALLKHGADDYCAKNVKKNVLLQRVEKLLARRAKNPLDHMMD